MPTCLIRNFPCCRKAKRSLANKIFYSIIFFYDGNQFVSQNTPLICVKIKFHPVVKIADVLDNTIVYQFVLIIFFILIFLG